MTNLTDYRAEQIADEAARRLEQPELKPCPFCGGEATLHPFFSGCYMAVCKECSVTMPMRDTYEEAIEAWNNRAEPQKVAIANVTFTQEQIDEIKEYCLRNLSRYTPVEVVEHG